MNWDNIQGVLRAVLAAAGGYLIGSGKLDSANWELISGAAVALFTAGWSIFHNNQQTADK